MLDAFRDLAERYGGRLPDDYAEALASIRTVMKEHGLSPDEIGEVETVYFFADAALAEEENEEVRIEDPDLPSWPEGLFVIGQNGTGDLFFVDLSGAHPGVGCWDHEVAEPVYYDPDAGDQLGYAFASPLDYLHTVCGQLVEWRS